jgi:hypothetical protein
MKSLNASKKLSFMGGNYSLIHHHIRYKALQPHWWLSTLELEHGLLHHPLNSCNLIVICRNQVKLK